jgi:hypothetical protein
MRHGRRLKSGESSGSGDEYVDALFTVYKDRVPAEADFVCYWFAKAWEAMRAGAPLKAGNQPVAQQPVHEPGYEGNDGFGMETIICSVPSTSAGEERCAFVTKLSFCRDGGVSRASQSWWPKTVRPSLIFAME